MSCKICLSETSKIHNKLRDSNDYNVVKCQKCHTVQLDHFPEIEEDKHFYNENMQAKWVQEINLESIENKLKDDTIRRVEFIQCLLNKSGVVADIGTGYGFFVKEALKKGIDIDGYEIGDQRRALAESVTGKTIYNNNLLEGDQKLERSYDLITLFQVLEHISEPKLFLKKIYENLNVGGKIIIEVPNHTDWMIKECKNYEDFYYQRAHLFYYEAASLTSLLDSLDFKKVHFEWTQRYSISNAFHWILNGTPQIHNPNHYESGIRGEFDILYKNKLISEQRTDTLIAIVEK